MLLKLHGSSSLASGIILETTDTYLHFFIFSKILEKLLTRRLLDHSYKNILNNSQYGFRSGRSTEHAIHDMIISTKDA